MKFFNKIWEQFKFQLDIWFFYAFFITSNLSIRKIIYLLPVQGGFNEYTGAYFYLSDIFFFFLVFSWIIQLLNNKKSFLSSFKTTIVSRRTLIREWFFSLPLLLVIWAFISVFWADDKFIAFFRSAKLLEFFLVYLFVIWKIGNLGGAEKNVPLSKESSTPKNVPMFHMEHWNITGQAWNISQGEHDTGVEPINKAQFKAKNGQIDFLRNLILLCIVVGILNSLIAVGQFIFQHSLGLTIFRESIISPQIAGVAKIIIGGHKLIHSYGLFPHPNILGGFLLFSVLLNFALLKGKLSLVDVPHGTSIPTTKEKVPCETFFYFALIIQLLALVFTFSKSAFLALFLVLFYILANNYENFKSTLNKVKIPLLTAGIILTSLFFLFRVDLNSFILRSVNDRLGQYKIYGSTLNFAGISFHLVNSNFVPRGTKLENGASVEQFGQLIYGLGMGQYVLEIYRKFGNQLEWWQFQPVHNVFLLIFAELGLVGLVIFIAFLFKLIFSGDFKTFHPEKCSNVPRGTFEHYGAGVEYSSFLRDRTSITLLMKAMLLGFVSIMLFDHYLWDIQQGQIILWLVAAIIISLRQRRMAQSAHH